MDAQVLATPLRTQAVLGQTYLKKIKKIQLFTVAEMFVRSPYTSRGSGTSPG